MLSDRIVVEITQKPGKSFIDRMIALVEGASRQKTPNEIALNSNGITGIVLVSLLVCLIPTTIGALLSAIGIAGDVNTLLLDKTGTITLGNRQPTDFVPVEGVQLSELAAAAQLSSLADETPEGRSIVVLAKNEHGLRGARRALRPVHRADAHERGRRGRT